MGSRYIHCTKQVTPADFPDSAGQGLVTITDTHPCCARSALPPLPCLPLWRHFSDYCCEQSRHNTAQSVYRRVLRLMFYVT